MSHNDPRVPQGRTALNHAGNCNHLNKADGRSLPVTEEVAHQRSVDAAEAIAEVATGTEAVDPAMAAEEAREAVDNRLTSSIQ